MTNRIGIDAGSKTLKLIVMNEADELVYSTYLRHRSNIPRALSEAIHDLNWKHGPIEATVAMTGSGAIEVATALNIPFVQEVVATTTAVRRLIPDADVAIELGGEDAKIIYLTGGIEQRMNASCAGGTGGFIDTIAYMLDIRPAEISQLAFGASRSYPIASRCAVFAQTDVRPLLNAGVSKADIAASAFDAVVHQTLGGLACGRPILGKVVFLGGPLEHMPYLVHDFRQALKLNADTGLKPASAHLFTVMGAALLSDDPVKLNRAPTTVNTQDLQASIDSMEAIESDIERLPPLFASKAELTAFKGHHSNDSFDRIRLSEAEGPFYLGIDAGSTTLKLAAIDQDGCIVHSFYEPIRGNMIETLRQALRDLYRAIQPPSYLTNEKPRAWVARSCATGYGEELLRAAFGVEMGAVETAAHLRSARELCPDLTFLLDIGGQDMKALWVRDGMVTDAALNEACSSGCGAFLEGTAAALRSSPIEFAKKALEAQRPIDLGTKCTVFMNSRVKQAQKSGVPIDEIAAGMAYSVVKNALHRIIGDGRKPRPGDKVVVQGGTFKSDAVLRAFELISGVKAIRPDEAHLMGAIGCALLARDAACAQAGDRSSLVSDDELETLQTHREKMACTGCANACTLTVMSFDEEKSRCFINDNQCERGLDELKRRANSAILSERDATPVILSERDATPVILSERDATPVILSERSESKDLKDSGDSSNDAPPNVVALEQQLIASFGDLAQKGPRGALCIGIVDAMALCAYRPFWHTLCTKLGFSVVVPKEGCETDKASIAWETIPSESVCYPAKLAHARFFSLCDKGCDGTFMPLFARSFHCAVQTRYGEALASNVVGARNAKSVPAIISPELANYKPGRFMRDAESVSSLLEALNEFIGDRGPSITPDELNRAITEAMLCQDKIVARIEQATEEAFAWLGADPARHGIVLAGRPYHMDEALLHGIDRELMRLDFAVLSATGLNDLVAAQKGKRLGGVHPWIPAKRLVRLAHAVAASPQLDAVFLQSFGCGYEPLTIAEATDVLDEAGKPCTVLTLDDISDLAHVRIRLRTLKAAIELRETTPVILSERSGNIILSERSESKNPRSLANARDDESANPRAKIEAGSLIGIGNTEADVCFLDSIAAEPLNASDLEVARQRGVKDICFTANAMAARVIRMLEQDPTIRCIELPEVCETCITQAIPRIVERATGYAPGYVWTPWVMRDAGPEDRAYGIDGSKPRIGLVGNPLIVFEPFMNDGIVSMLEELGCEVVLPDPALITGEDVRYIEQLEVYERVGIRNVIYLLSFGCLKGHVQGRGALRELRRCFPTMNLTIIDFDPETSALNRENRIRLAVEAARDS